MAASKSLYDVLGVAPEAEPVVIDAAYKALMKKYHPDHAEESAPASRSAAEINEAFAVLKDAERRSEYDRGLWSRQQALRLAELKAMEVPRRGGRLFAWSGWLVAAAIGVAFAATAANRDIGVPVPVAALEAAAKAEARRVAPEEALSRKAAAALRPISDLPSGDAVIARVRAETARTPAATAPRARSTSTAPARPVQLRKAPLRKPTAAGRRKPAEKGDFLEREGYIY